MDEAIRQKLREIAHEALGDDPVRGRLRDFAISIQALRLFECGFEDTINDYSAAELLLLAMDIPQSHRAVILEEALTKADTALIDALNAAGMLEGVDA